MNQWTFQIKDVIDDNGASVSVFAETYSGALIKVMNLGIPDLEEDELVLMDTVEIKTDN